MMIVDVCARQNVDPCCAAGPGAVCSGNERGATVDSCKGEDVVTTSGGCSRCPVSEPVTKPGSCCGEQTANATSCCQK